MARDSLRIPHWVRVVAFAGLLFGMQAMLTRASEEIPPCNSMIRNSEDLTWCDPNVEAWPCDHYTSSTCPDNAMDENPTLPKTCKAGGKTFERCAEVNVLCAYNVKCQGNILVGCSVSFTTDETKYFMGPPHKYHTVINKIYRKAAQVQDCVVP